MTPRITRRALLAGGVVAAVPAVWLTNDAITARPKVLADFLKGQLPGLAVSDTALNDFANQYNAWIDPGQTRKLYHEALFLLLANPDLAAMAPARVHSVFDDFTRRLMTRFLFSTDFFGAAGQRPERTSYVGYSDAYASGCGNPIARFT